MIPRRRCFEMSELKPSVGNLGLKEYRYVSRSVCLIDVAYVFCMFLELTTSDLSAAELFLCSSPCSFVFLVSLGEGLSFCGGIAVCAFPRRSNVGCYLPLCCLLHVFMHIVIVVSTTLGRDHCHSSLELYMAYFTRPPSPSFVRLAC